MALNTNIALGVQPIQQPNMLAQYAQVMGIKAAQQEMEGSEDVRRYFSAPADQRGDISQILHTKGGRAASETLSQNAQRELKMELDALGAAKENVYMAKDPAALAEYMKGVYSSPAGKLLSRFVPIDKALAAIPTDPVAFKEYQKNFGLTAEKIVANATTERGQNMTYGATIRGQDITDRRLREQTEYERKNPTLQRVDGENGFYLYNPRDPNSAVPLGMRPPAAAPVAQPSAVNNLMMTTQPTPSVNALTQPAPNQPGAPTVANANALANQPTIIRPKQPIRQPVAIIGPDGKSVLVPPEQAVGKQPATPFAESTAEKKAQLNRDIETAIRNLEEVVKPGGLLEKSTGSGAGRLYDASASFFGKGTEGAIAGAQLAPIADMVLKMVPRFEGPQSNKDVDSYLAAAGKLADTGLPNEIRKGAAETILKLMKERKGQFEIKGQGGAGGGAPADPLGIR
jgi:hypothetical protein